VRQPRAVLALILVLLPLLSACAGLPNCDLRVVRLLYLEPGDAEVSLPETWLARRCSGILTLGDSAALSTTAASYPTAGLLIHREMAGVLAEPWLAEEFETGRPLMVLDMNMSEFDNAAPFVRLPVMRPVRRPGEMLWAGVCRREQGIRSTVTAFDNTASLITWSAACWASQQR
jgi:hypothetical protein